MRIVRGRGPSAERDRERSRELVSSVAETGEPLLRIWQPHRHVAFGRRDSNRPGYERARALADEHGFVPVDRTTGGHAVCFTGNTVSFVRVTPVDDLRGGIDERYQQTTETLETALSELGVSPWVGEPDGAFCPGTHSISDEGKMVGLAQRVKRDVAVVAGIVVVRDHEDIAEVLGPIYDALDISFERNATGSIARSGGTSDPGRVIETLESHLADPGASVERLRET